MSFCIAVAGGDYHGCRVGTNGSQQVMMGYWLAAYAVARRPDSNRVCAWVDSRWEDSPRLHREAPWTMRNRPSTVRALIAFSYDDDGDGTPECGAVLPQHSTIERGLKLKPPADPMLVDLVAWYRQCCGPERWYGTLDPEPTARLADHVELLLPYLEASESWFEQMQLVADVFAVARERGVGVRFG